MMHPLFMTNLTELQEIRSLLSEALSRIDALLEIEQRPGDRTANDLVALDRTKAIEWVLGQAKDPMRPVEIWAELLRYGRNDTKMEVQVTTFDLWHRGRIGKIGRGVYVGQPDVLGQT